MLSSAEREALALCLLIYLRGIWDVYEFFVGKTENKIGSVLCALVYPVSIPIVVIITLLRGALTYGNNSES